MFASKAVRAAFGKLMAKAKPNAWKAGVMAATASFGAAAVATTMSNSESGVANLFSRLFTTAHASDEEVIPLTPYPWSHKGILGSFDHNAIRRGFKVYQTVCASCHSLNYIAYRHLVDVAYTEAEMKAFAADVEVEDGPNDKGDMFTRPGKLTDYIPSPYPNEQAARAANNGAYPLDLSLIIKARMGTEDYLFSLLTGYKEPPPGVTVKPGMSYNPYFPGAQIAMPQQLTNDMLEYDDGTEASISQLAKDVTTFLSWAAEPTQDEHKLYGLKGVFLAALLTVQLIYWKRFKWSIFKNRRIAFTRPRPFDGPETY